MLLRFDASLVHGVVVVVENDGPVIDSTGGRPPARQELLGTYKDSIQEKGGWKGTKNVKIKGKYISKRCCISNHIAECARMTYQPCSHRQSAHDAE